VSGPSEANPATEIDPEVKLEQSALDRARRALDAMRVRAQGLLDELRAAGNPDLDYEAALAHRVATLGESRRPLLFGRIDEIGGTRWRIGRRHVEDDCDVVVVDWRAPVSVPFYQARPGDSLGLTRRRQIMVEANRVLTVADDIFDAEGVDVGNTRLRGGDALLVELERARVGEMLDIVATIQAEQDVIIRGPLEGTVVVQGGPGTGKTAVGLHRAAFLLYNHPELARSGVLVLGPSRAFLRYIAQVLPSLGEESVVQTTVGDLAPRVRVSATDPPGVDRLKGDARMAQVVAAGLACHRVPLGHPTRLTARHLSITLEADEVNALVSSIASTGTPYKAGRTAVRARLISLARGHLRARGRFEVDDEWFTRELSASRSFRALLDDLWPSVSPSQLVADLLSRPELLAEAAQGALAPDEIRALLRPRAATRGRTQWTAGDLALLDEANFRINGRTRTYGHIVCDEAQDLSPMQYRMLSRRTANGSLTVLGDIAQATGTHAYSSWDDIVPFLPPSPEVRREELTVGYRAPAQILELASRLLPVAAPSVRPTTSIREGRVGPSFIRVTPDVLVKESLDTALALAAEGFLVGAIVAEGSFDAELRRLARRDSRVGLLEEHGITRPATIVRAPLAKGLEFDAVVVVEPASIAEAELVGLRLLYVALTRPIQRLTIVHDQALPDAMTGGAAKHGITGRTASSPVEAPLADS
jgi:DNA helicase IV